MGTTFWTDIRGSQMTNSNDPEVIRVNTSGWTGNEHRHPCQLFNASHTLDYNQVPAKPVTSVSHDQILACEHAELL